MGKKHKQKNINMPPRTKKARVIRFLETYKPDVNIQCLECDACCSESYFLTCDNWKFIHADTFHRTPQTLRSAPPRRKILPLMATRATPEEYKKLKRQDRKRRQFKGIKDRGEGASFRWF